VSLSPEHRRLRFSFQFNNVKDQDQLGWPHCLAPVGGGGGYLVAGLVSVNRLFPVTSFVGAEAIPKAKD
jgi:hypothetical protein